MFEWPDLIWMIFSFRCFKQNFGNFVKTHKDPCDVSFFFIKIQKILIFLLFFWNLFICWTFLCQEEPHSSNGNFLLHLLWFGENPSWFYASRSVPDNCKTQTVKVGSWLSLLKFDAIRSLQCYSVFTKDWKYDSRVSLFFPFCWWLLHLAITLDWWCSLQLLW